MRTNNLNIPTILVFLFISVFVLPVRAQSTVYESVHIHLDTVSVVQANRDFNNMVSKIVSNGNFRYRKTLKHAKLNQKEYAFNNSTISEVEILKHFKKAARKSDCVEEFVSYFHERDFKFLKMLEDYVIAGLYNTMRKTTFNGFLDSWQSYY